MSKEFFLELGIKPLINAAATQTVLGGSIMNPRVLEAMEQASKHFYDIRDLHKAVAGRIATLTKNEDAMVSAGVASAFYLVTMALLQRDDPVSFKKIPKQFPQNKSIVLYRSHEVEYVCGIEQAGVSLRCLGERGQQDFEGELLEKALENEKPLAFLYVMAGGWLPKGPPALERAIEVCRRHGVPIIVDAAAQLPPKSNLWNFTQAGADVVLFSGGKDLRGPCHTGLVLGCREIVGRCREIISPQDGVGRFFKIGKEELFGALAAVEEYLAQNEEQRLALCEAQVEKMIAGLSGLKGVTAKRRFPNEAGQPIPRIHISYDRDIYPRTPEQVVEDFHSRPTAIAFLLEPENGFYCNPMTLQPGESEQVIKEIHDYFSNLNRE